MEGQLKAHLKPTKHYNTIVLRGLREALIGHLLYRETSVSRTPNVSFFIQLEMLTTYELSLTVQLHQYERFEKKLYDWEEL